MISIILGWICCWCWICCWYQANHDARLERRDTRCSESTGLLTAQYSSRKKVSWPDDRATDDLRELFEIGFEEYEGDHRNKLWGICYRYQVQSATFVGFPLRAKETTIWLLKWRVFQSQEPRPGVDGGLQIRVYFNARGTARLTTRNRGSVLSAILFFILGVGGGVPH